MLENFVVCVEAVLPLFLLMLVGMLVRKAGILTEEENKKFNRMVFVVCFPAMTFENLYGANLHDAWNGKLVAFAVGALLIVYFVSIPIIMKIEPSNKSRGALIQAIYRSNFVIMGLPVATNIYGHGNLGVTAMLVAVIVPLYNVLAVITLERFRDGNISPVKLLKGVLTNPLILGAFAGILFLVTGWKLPHLVEGVISDLGVAATTMSLVILGASFRFGSVKNCGRNLFIGVVGRLLVVPGIFLPIAAGMGIRGIGFVSLVAMLSAPTAISSYTMAESMGSDGELAGNCVIFSSLFASITMFFWLFIFKNMGIF